MNYQISHTTTYEYPEIVAACQNVVHLAPRAVLNQTCHHHRLVVRPTPSSISRRMDYFGNPVTHFSINEGHRKLTITSMSRIEVRDPVAPAAETAQPWEQVRDNLLTARGAQAVENLQFCYDSPRIERSEELVDYAIGSFFPGRSIVEAIVDLTTRINKDFVYDQQATTVNTPLAEVFATRRGVCQDLAHVQIGCLRSLGLAARYVSGYLRTIPPPGKLRLIGADASHAWLSVHCGPAGWVDCDPTNNSLVGTDHVTIGWGRDYADVCPINGVFIGGGQHLMTVSADVEPLDEGKRAS